MTLTPVLGYKDIFSDNNTSKLELIKDIPSRVLLQLFSRLNAMIFFKNSRETQHQIINLILHRQSKNLLSMVQNSLGETDSKGGMVFISSVCLDCIHYVLLNPVEIDGFNDTTPSQELNVFAFYLLSVDEFNDSQEYIPLKEDPLDHFRKNFWPPLFKVGIANNTTESIQSSTLLAETLKGMELFDFLGSKMEFAHHLVSFCKRYNVNHPTHVVLEVAFIILSAMKNSTLGNTPHYLNDTKSLGLLLNDFCLNSDRYAETYSQSPRGFTGIKSHPLIKIKDDLFLVLDWKFLMYKLYNGIIYDFHKHSGLDQVSRFAQFKDFKSYLGKYFIEDTLFQKIITELFENQKFCEIGFDNIEGVPDGYVLCGNDLFVFELKDTNFKLSALEHNNADEIQREINEHFVTEKGIPQIIKSLQYLEEKFFGARPYSQKLKRRNLCIYPIIVYSDSHFALPGVYEYLKDIFLQEQIKANLSPAFKKIQSLSFISLSFLIEHSHIFKSRRLNFKELITFEQKYKKQKRKDLMRKIRNSTLTNPMELIKYQDNFESAVAKKIQPHYKSHEILDAKLAELKKIGAIR